MKAQSLEGYSQFAAIAIFIGGGNVTVSPGRHTQDWGVIFIVVCIFVFNGSS